MRSQMIKFFPLWISFRLQPNSYLNGEPLREFVTIAKMKVAALFLALIALVYSSAIPPQKQIQNVASIDPRIDEDAILSVPELLEKYGYPCETHRVVTSDGYILTLHRIPHGKNSDTVSSDVVFLQHGLLSSSADWIISGVGKGLGYIMADEGYDVWMGNARGNTESRNHTSLDTDSAEFWDFSWHEIGNIDLPTMIDYVLEQTGQPNLFYAGHSQGTTSFFVMTSTRPEYNDKIRAQFSLAPIAFMNHMTSPLMKLIAIFDGPLSVLLNIIGIHEFLPNNDFLAGVGDVLCGDNSILQPLCTNALFAICGFSGNEMNATLLPILMGHTPAGSSTMQFLHYAQGINSGYFRKWDYGILENLNKYGSLRPPSYELNKITAPVYLLYSHNDWLAAEVDVEKLYRELGNARGKFLVSDNSFNHLDYMYGIDAPKLVYNKLLSLMQKHL